MDSFLFKGTKTVKGKKRNVLKLKKEKENEGRKIEENQIKEWHGLCHKRNNSSVELLHNAHGGRQARKPANSPSSQSRTSHAIPRDITPYNAGGRNNNRCSSANQCTELGVPTWLKRASTVNWTQQLNNSQIARSA